MPFSKFDPHRPQDEEDGLQAVDPSARRRALLLKYAWWVSTAYVLMGFAFMAYWIVRARLA